jgi:hypothetical protein
MRGSAILLKKLFAVARLARFDVAAFVQQRVAHTAFSDCKKRGNSRYIIASVCADSAERLTAN